MLRMLVLAAGLAAGRALHDVTEEQYNRMPRLFWLDDYDTCLAARDGAYCLGTFQLAADQHNSLFEFMKAYSEDTSHYNHTLLHRGYCVSARCSHIDTPLLREKFTRCVDQYTSTKYGLRAKLLHLDYCKKSNTRDRPLDVPEIVFAAFVAFILLVNIVGTVYDLTRDPNKKHKYADRYLLPWSVRVNWQRLTADYDEEGDPRITALNPVHGIRAISLIAVMLGHTFLVAQMSYVQNPRFVDTAGQHPLAMLIYNGSLTVQGFFALASFLFAYNMLLFAEKHKDSISLKRLPLSVLYRFFRLAPVHMFAVGLTATWWRRAAAGPLAARLLAAEARVCRRKWWAHLLFIHNFVQPHDKCLVHTWFLAVDMQVYIVTSVLMFTLVQQPRAVAVRALSALLAASILANFLIAYHWDLKPLFMISTNVEVMRVMCKGDASFAWLYCAPWGSLPAALAGLLLAYAHYRIQHTRYRLQDNQVLMVVYRWCVPLLVLWCAGARWVPRGGGLAAAAVAAIDRPGYVLIVAIAMLGFVNNVDGLWRRIVAWRGWRPLGRVSLSAFMLHWHYTVLVPAQRAQTTYFSILELGGNWLVVVLLSYLTAVPLYLLLEAPAQKFMVALFTTENKKLTEYISQIKQNGRTPLTENGKDNSQ